jgi:S-adenosylhomocysteine hydrolase
LARENVTSRLPELLDKGDPEAGTVLLDIGGWFAPTVRALPQLSERILGVVEDTRNGQDKYEHEAMKGSFPVPIISVAESELKANEDFLVGQSVVFSADVLLRECGQVIEYLECGVIGYGKIGRSIARHLKDRGIRPLVVEIDPLRRLAAFRERCEVRDRDWVNRSVDVLFCATGKQATDIIDFRTLKPGAFFFSVTSSDDEFDLDLLRQEYERREISQYVSRHDGSHNHFYLVNNGNAANFLHNAVLWEFIQLVKGGIYLALRNLACGENMSRIFPGAGDGRAGLWELTKEQERGVAELWMETVLLGANLEK